MTDLPADAITAAAEALATHRWKTMGVASAECECGTVVHGDADPFPADEAFRRHLATAVLEAAAPHIITDVLARVEQGIADGAAEVIAQAVRDERERCARLALAEAGETDDGVAANALLEFADLLREDTP